MLNFYLKHLIKKIRQCKEFVAIEYNKLKFTLCTFNFVNYMQGVYESQFILLTTCEWRKLNLYKC